MCLPTLTMMRTRTHVHLRLLIHTRAHSRQAHGFSKVVSIDPGAMDPRLMEVSGDSIQHMAMTAQAASNPLEDADVKFSVMVCDVNAKATVIVKQLLLPLMGRLQAGSPLILTLKLCKRVSDASAIASGASAQRILETVCEGFEVVHLLSNTVRVLLCRLVQDDILIL